jgi:DNA-binding Lrp family transcriptional regulator
MKSFKPDTKDKRILYELLQNARFTHCLIGKHVQLSREMVAYKIGKMQKAGVIKGFTSHLFRPSIGLMQSYALYITLQCSKTKKQEMIKELNSYDNILAITEMEGWFNLYIYFCAYNRANTYETFQFIKETCSLSDNYELVTVVTNEFTRRYFFLGDIEIKKKKYNDILYNLLLKHRGKRGEHISELDDEDLAILNILNKNGRTPIQNIGKRLKLAPFAIRRRIIKLIKKGVFYSFSPVIDYCKLGYIEYFLLLRLNPTKNKPKLLTFLNKHSFIRRSYVGKWDYKYIIYTKSSEEIKGLISDLLDKFPDTIGKYDLLWSTNVHKSISYPEKIEDIYHLAKSSQSRG